MKQELIFPTKDQRLPFNLSLTFDVSDEESAVEILALDIPDNAVVLVERGFQIDDCADMTWTMHKDPCCDEVRLTSAGNGTILSLPGKYRVTIAALSGGDIVAPQQFDVANIKVLAIHYTDESGAIRLRHNCCGPTTLCDRIGTLTDNARVGGCVVAYGQH